MRRVHLDSIVNFDKRNTILEVSAKKRRTPLVKDLTYNEHHRLSQSPRFTHRQEITNITATLKSRHTFQQRNLQSSHGTSTTLLSCTASKQNTTGRYQSTHAHKNFLEQLIAATGMSLISVSSLTEGLWRVLSPGDKVIKVKLCEVASIFEVLAQHSNNKQRCVQLLRDIVERHLKSKKVAYNKLTLNSHLSQLYQCTVKIKEPGLGFLRYRFRPFLQKENISEKSPSRHSTNKFDELFEQSKDRSRRKQERQYQRILKEVSADNKEERSTNYQQTLRLYQNTLYTSKGEEKPAKLARKPTSKIKSKPNRYSHLHAYKTAKLKQHDHQPLSILFELNIKIDDQVTSVQIRDGESPLDVVDRLRKQLDVSHELQLQLVSMIQQYIDEHHSTPSSQPH